MLEVCGNISPHSDVRWLSQSNAFMRLFELQAEQATFT